MDTTTPPPVPGQTTLDDALEDGVQYLKPYPYGTDMLWPLDMQMHHYAVALRETAKRLDWAADHWLQREGDASDESAADRWSGRDL